MKRRVVINAGKHKELADRLAAAMRAGHPIILMTPFAFAGRNHWQISSNMNSKDTQSVLGEITRMLNR